jgi:hypothetical protein
MRLRGESRTRILVAAFVAGAQALLAQTLLLREELVLYGGNEVALGAFLCLWLLGITGGALAVRRFGERASRLATPALLAPAGLLLLAMWAARAARALSGIPAYEPFPLTLLLLWSIPIAVPVALAIGVSVPALAARARSAGGSVTAIYVTEALGSFVGGAGTTLLLAVGCEPAILVFVCATLGAAGAGLLEQGLVRRALVALGVALVVLAPVAGPGLGRVLREQQLAAILRGAKLLDHAETATGSLTLASLERQQVLLADGWAEALARGRLRGGGPDAGPAGVRRRRARDLAGAGPRLSHLCRAAHARPGR